MTARRVDENQKEIVAALRKAGVSVLILSDLGKGCPDIAIGFETGWGKRNYFLELKNGDKPLSAQKLTSAEQSFFDTWRGQVAIVRSVNDALNFVNNIKMGLPC